MWLNNCIGAANHKAFLYSIVSAAIMTGIVLGTSIVLLCSCLADPDGFVVAVEDLVPSMIVELPMEVLATVLGLLILMNGPFFAMDAQLCFLHAFLHWQEMTTYEYIVYKQDRQDKATIERLAATGTTKPAFTLPHCCDWIFFSRCGRKRRKKPQEEAKDSSGAEHGPVKPPPAARKPVTEATAVGKSLEVIMAEKIDLALDYNMVKIEDNDQISPGPPAVREAKVTNGKGGFDAVHAAAAEACVTSHTQRLHAAGARSPATRNLSAKLGKRSFSICSLVPLAAFPCAEPIFCPRVS